MTTSTDPEAPAASAKNVLGYLGQTQSALDTITKILTTLTLLGGAASAFAQQGNGRIVAGGVVLVSVVVLLWQLRRPLRSDAPASVEPAVRPSLRGLLHFDVEEPLYERKRVLDTLFGRTVARGAHVNILIGDAHCGKTSLLLAGLVTSLKASPDPQGWSPVYVAHPGHTIDPMWDPEAAIAEALADASDTPPASSFGEAVARAVAAKPASTFVVIYDQFEQFFLANPTPEARARLLDWVSVCVNDDDLAVRFVFALRTGFEACISELEKAIRQPIPVNNFQTTVTRFQPSEARRALDAIVEHDHLRFAPALRSALIRDLTKTGSVCPAELQIVSKWLYERGITTAARYQLAGQADGLFSEFLTDQTRRIDQLAANNVAGKILLALARRSAGRRLDALSRDDLVRCVAPEQPAESEGGMRLVRGPLDSALAQLMLSGLVIEEPDHRYRLVHDYFADYVLQVSRPRTTFGSMTRLPRALASAYGTKAAVGVLLALFALLLGACTFAQTKAGKIQTLPSHATRSNVGFEVFGSNGDWFAVGDDSPGLTFGVEVWNLPDHQQVTPLPHADLRTLESQQAYVKQWVDSGYTVLFIGHADQPEAGAAAALDADHVKIVQNMDDVGNVQVEDHERVAFVSQTTLGTDEVALLKSAIRERIPGSIDADRRQFVPLGLQFGSDKSSLRLVAADEVSKRWGVWTWDVTQPQLPPTNRSGSLQRTAPPCSADGATISGGLPGERLLAIDYACGPILLIKPDASVSVYSEPLNRQLEEQNCVNNQLFFTGQGELYGLYQCSMPGQPTAYRLRHWTPTELTSTAAPTSATSPQPGDLVLGGTPKEAKDLKFADDPSIRAVVVDSNDALRAVVRAQTSVELRAVDKGKRLSWLDVGDVGDASPSPDGRYMVRSSSINDVTVFDLYEMGAWLDTGTTFGSVRLWSWMENLRSSVPVVFGP